MFLKLKKFHFQKRNFVFLEEKLFSKTACTEDIGAEFFVKSTFTENSSEHKGISP